jgi:hypothetical protein
MKFWHRRESSVSGPLKHTHDSLEWHRSRFFSAGHYRVPAVEDTVGLTSASKVVLNRPQDEIRRLTDLTFSSIEATSKDVKNDAITRVRLRQQQELRDFLMGA